MRKEYKVLLFLISSFFNLSCGYSLVGHGRTLPDSIHSIAIPILQNSTNEPNLEVIASNALINEFILDGRLKVKEINGSDLKMTGEIVSYSLRPVSFDNSDNVSEYKVELGIKVDVKEAGSEKSLLAQTFTGEWDFAVSSEISVTEPQRIEAVKEASKIASKKMISILIEGF